MNKHGKFFKIDKFFWNQATAHYLASDQVYIY